MSKKKRLSVRITDTQWDKLEKHIKNKKQNVSQWVSDRIDLMRSKP